MCLRSVGDGTTREHTCLACSGSTGTIFGVGMCSVDIGDKLMGVDGGGDRREFGVCKNWLESAGWEISMGGRAPVDDDPVDGME